MSTPSFRGTGRRTSWLVGLLLSSACATALAECRMQTLELPVRLVNSRPIVNISIEGQELPMLLDSGAFHSFLLPSTAAQLRLPLQMLPNGASVIGYTGEVESRIARVREILFAGLPIRNIEFIVGGNEIGSGIRGILGRNILSVADTEYDLAQGMVRLHFPQGDCRKHSMAYWAGQAPVIVADLDKGPGGDDKAIRVTTRINGKKTRAMLDTGAPSTWLNLRAARRAGIKDESLVEVGRASGAGKGSARAWVAPIQSFELGTEKISDYSIPVADVDKTDEYEMLLGLDYFLSHRLFVSRLQGKLYATWNGGPVFARGQTQGQYDSRFAAKPEDAGDAEALLRHAAAAQARGDGKQAMEDLNRAVALAPQSVDARLARARLLAMRPGKQRVAMDDLNEALQLDESRSDARILRAQVRQVLGQRDAALADMTVLDETLPPTAPLRKDMADVYAEFAMLPEALRQWALWIPAHRDDTAMNDLLNSRCWLRARLGQQLKEALDDCNQAIEQERHNANFHDSLGWLRLRLGDEARALKAFDKAIELQKKPEPMSLYGRALAHRRLGNAEAAARDLDAARKLRPAIEAEAKKEGFDLAE